jgi:hypothetical protein
VVQVDSADSAILALVAAVVVFVVAGFTTATLDRTRRSGGRARSLSRGDGSGLGPLGRLLFGPLGDGVGARAKQSWREMLVDGGSDHLASHGSGGPGRVDAHGNDGTVRPLDKCASRLRLSHERSEDTLDVGLLAAYTARHGRKRIKLLLESAPARAKKPHRGSLIHFAAIRRLAAISTNLVVGRPSNCVSAV